MNKATFDAKKAYNERESAQDTLLALLERVEFVKGCEEELSAEDIEKLIRLNTLLDQAFEFFHEFGGFDDSEF